MASITITIPVVKIARVVDGVCRANNYSAMIGLTPNPETKRQFAERMVRNYIKSQVAAAEGEEARAAAFDAVDADKTLVT